MTARHEDIEFGSEAKSGSSRWRVNLGSERDWWSKPYTPVRSWGSLR
jgi:hypothetical protein